jgi:ADP-heptose:LPS heptosyltransferase
VIRPEPRIVAVRLGRLGDLVMTLPALTALDDAATTLLTSAAHVDWLSSALPRIRVTASAEGLVADAALDLHGVPASRRVLRTLQADLVVRTDKEGLRRRLLLFGLPTAMATWPERHLRAAAALRTRLGLPARVVDARPRLGVGARRTAGPPRLGLVPGAAHATKRWPVERFADLARRFRAEAGGTCAAIGEDRGLLDVLAAAGAEPCAEASIPAMIDQIAGCDVVVAGDTGPLHLAGALSVPVVALFGPTPRDAGFFVWDGEARVPALDCSPCRMHGSERCPRGERRCMEAHPVEDVFAAVLRCLP